MEVIYKKSLKEKLIDKIREDIREAGYEGKEIDYILLDPEEYAALREICVYSSGTPGKTFLGVKIRVTGLSIETWRKLDDAETTDQLAAEKAGR